MVKKFIDKKTALRFKLVQRSVHDSSDREFVPMNARSERMLSELQLDASKEEVDVLGSSTVPAAGEAAGEAAKYGIFYDDRTYDYTKHLKSVGEAAGAVLLTAPALKEPTKTVADDSEDGAEYENEGVLNHATYDNIHDIHLDPAVREVLEALEDEEFESDFEDDLVVKLDREDTAVLCTVDDRRQRHHPGASGRRSNFTDDEDESDVDSGRATTYRGTCSPSMAITSIDSKFEALLRVYDGDDDGLEEVDVEFDGQGSGQEEATDELLQQALDDFINNQASYIRPSVAERNMAGIALLDKIRKELGPVKLDLLSLEASASSDDTDADIDVGLEDYSDDGMREKQKALDCQSILTTLTNTENLPGVIREAPRRSAATRAPIIRLSRRTGLPILPQEDTDERQAAVCSEQEEEMEKGGENRGVARPRAETAEEKRARKASIRSERRECRANKKELKVRFQLEKTEAASTLPHRKSAIATRN